MGDVPVRRSVVAGRRDGERGKASRARAQRPIALQLRRLASTGTLPSHFSGIRPTCMTRRGGMLEAGGASMREFHCKDVGMPDCSFVAKGKDDDEVMRKAAEHAKRDHHM